MKKMISVGALLLFGTVALCGADLPKLPKDLVLPRSADSPGVVTFRHSTHVDSGRPDCSGCHPGTFKILRSTARKEVIKHATMEKGKLCGKCHDGKSATGLDSCETCHKAE